jgi:2-isopropylmalate synthase
MQVQSGQSLIPTATIRLARGDDVRTGSASGDGPVDAVFKAIRALTGADHTLVEYRINAITAGTDAMGESSLTIRSDAVQAHGRSAHTDIIMASANAYLQAINGLERKLAAIQNGSAADQGQP